VPTKVSAAVSHIPLFEEIPNRIKDAVIRSVLKEDETLNDNIVAATITGLYNKAKLWKDNTKKNPKLIQYSPDPGYIVVNSNYHSTIKAEIAASKGLTPADINLTTWDVDTHVDYPYLVYPAIQAIYPNFSPTNTVLFNDGSEDVWYLETIRRREEYIAIDSQYNEIVRVPLANPSHTYYTARYGINPYTPATDPIYYWAYNASINNNSNLPDIGSALSDDDYYPIIPLRLNGLAIQPTKDVPDDAYKFSGHDYDSIKRNLNLLNLEIDQINESINENPDADKIDDAFFVMVINFFNEESYAVKYIYKYMDEVKDLWPSSLIEYLTDSSERYLTNHRGDFKYRLKCEYYRDETLSENMGDVGTLEKSMTGSGIMFKEQINQTEVRKLEFFGLSVEYLVVYYGHQVKPRYSESEHRDDVFGTKIVNVAVNSSTSIEEQNGATIPLNKAVLDSLPFTDRSKVSYASASLIITALDVQDLKWYEDPGFLQFIQIIGFGLAIFTAGQSLVAAVSISTSAFIYTVIDIVITYVLLDYTVEWIYENIGGFIGQLIAIGIALYAGKVDISLNALIKATAEQLMQIITIISDTISTYTKIGYDKVLEEYGNFKADYEEELERLTNLEEDLGLGDERLPLYMQLDLYTNLFDSYETPNDYYVRKAHTMNPGVGSLDMIENYVDLSLRLPELT